MGAGGLAVETRYALSARPDAVHEHPSFTVDTACGALVGKSENVDVVSAAG
jgi:hypothetical protein